MWGGGEGGGAVCLNLKLVRGYSTVVERLTRDRMVAGLSPAGVEGEFSFPQGTFFADPRFALRSTPLSPQ